MIDTEDLDLIYSVTSCDLHVPMPLYAMNSGRHVAIEVSAAKSIDECWELVETSEKTKMHCMMCENCCYNFFELLTLNMAAGLFWGHHPW